MSRRKHHHRRYFRNVEKIAAVLSECYGDHSHGNKVNPLRELLFIICSVQTNQTLYQSTYTNLLAAFPSFSRLANAGEDEIAEVIAHGGLSNQKSRTIKAVLARLISDFGKPTLSPLRRMSDKECKQYLESLPGIGRKTAKCVMMYSLNRGVFPVDSNCWRICRRIGWVRPTRPNKSCSPRDMDRVEAGIPSNLRFSLHVNLVSHGRACCLPSRPNCESCCIRHSCQTGKRQLNQCS